MVATNSLLVADTLSDASDVDVLLIGGILRGNIRAAIGGEAERAVSGCGSRPCSCRETGSRPRTD